MAFFPAFLIFISIVFWAVLAVKRNRMSYMKREVFGTIVIAMFLTHPSVLASGFSTWSCKELDRDEYWIVKDYSIR